MSAGSSPRPGRGLPRPVVLLIGAAAAVLALAGVRAVAGIVGPAFLALVLVISVRPLQPWLRRRGVPGWLGVVAVVLVVYAILLALLAGLAYTVAQLVVLLPRYSSQFSDLLAHGTRLLRDLGVSQKQLQDAVGQLDLSTLVGPLQQVLGGVRTVLSDLLFLVTLVLFLAVDAAGFTTRLDALDGRHREIVAALWAYARTLRTYIVVSTVFGLVVAAFNVGELYLFAVPLPLLWGLLSFITNYIPNIGFVIGLLPPALLALLEHGPGRLLAVIVVYSITNLVIQSVIQPKVVGDSVGLTPTLTFLSLVFWTVIIGPLGAILAVPLSLLVKTLLVDADPALHWLRPLLGDTPDPPDADR